MSINIEHQNTNIFFKFILLYLTVEIDPALVYFPKSVGGGFILRGCLVLLVYEELRCLS